MGEIGPSDEGKIDGVDGRSGVEGKIGPSDGGVIGRLRVQRIENPVGGLTKKLVRASGSRRMGGHDQRSMAACKGIPAEGDAGKPVCAIHDRWIGW